MLHRNAIATCAVALIGLMAQGHAQVLRCTDARTGKVSYTNEACPSGASVREVEPRKTPEEIERERQQAAEALARKQQQLQAEAAAAAAQAERDRAEAARAAAAAPRVRKQDYARSPECARSRRNLDLAASDEGRSPYDQQVRVETAQRQVDLDCLGPEGYAEIEKARAAQPRVVVPPARYGVYPQGPFFWRAAPPPRRPPPCTGPNCVDSPPRDGGRKMPLQNLRPGEKCRSIGGFAPC